MLIGMLACSHQEVVQPVARSTDQIARIRERRSGSDSTDNRYAYDAQGRLATQHRDAWFNTGDYGWQSESADYTFSYHPNLLTVVKSGVHKFGTNVNPFGPYTEDVSLNEQGLADSTPGVYWDVRYLKIEALFDATIVVHYSQKAPRSYDEHGFLSHVISLDGTDKFTEDRSFSRGNLTQVSRTLERFKPISETATRRTVYTYNLQRAAPRSPYQFLGSTNQNVVQTERSFEGATVTYRYEYDGEGRVTHYVIDDGSWHGTTVGDITYVHP